MFIVCQHQRLTHMEQSFDWLLNSVTWRADFKDGSLKETVPKTAAAKENIHPSYVNAVYSCPTFLFLYVDISALFRCVHIHVSTCTVCVCVSVFESGLPESLAHTLAHSYLCVCVCLLVHVCMYEREAVLPQLENFQRAKESETKADRKRLLMGSFKLKRIRPWMWESNSLQSNGIGIELGK